MTPLDLSIAYETSLLSAIATGALPAENKSGHHYDDFYHLFTSEQQQSLHASQKCYWDGGHEISEQLTESLYEFCIDNAQEFGAMPLSFESDGLVYDLEYYSNILNTEQMNALEAILQEVV